MTADRVDDLTEEAVRRILKDLITQMDDDDQDDFFGTEGWRHRYRYE